jgi:hypothetical protein
MLPGTFIAFVDIWLSMQSLFGLFATAQNPLSVLLAIVLGASLTIVTVLLPLCRHSTRVTNVVPLPLLTALWVVLFAFDIATSFVAAVWYVVLRQSYREPIDLDRLTFDPANGWATAGVALVVLGAAAVCLVYGEALRVLYQKYLSRRNGPGTGTGL